MKPLPKNPDRRKTYYKITNKEENHYGLQYHDGLVEDFRTFNDNPESSCVEGGIYFTTSEYILDFFNYGTWIRPLKIPKDAKVILDPEGDKYRADKVFMYKRIPKSQYIRKVFNPNEFNWEKDSVILTTYPKYFDIWWDAERFNWEAGSMYLVKICNSHFKKWWDAEKFNWKVSHLLANYCNEYFDIWWDDERFNWADGSYYLASRCESHFKKWWNPRKFNWLDIKSLFDYCKEYKHIWFPECGKKRRK